MIKMYSLAIAIVLFTSCESNNIYFNIKEQAIISCNSKGINRLYIKNDSIAEFYTIIWNDDLKHAPKSFRFDQIDKNYLITRDWNNVEINKIDFKLLPFSHYTIERAQGDAATFKVFVETNSTGKIIKASPDICGEK